MRAAFRVMVPPSTAVAVARGFVPEGDASFNLADLRSVADAHGFHDWSDDNLRSMMGLVGETVAVDKDKDRDTSSGGIGAAGGGAGAGASGAPEMMRVRLADLTRLAEHVGAKKSVM